MMELLIAMVRNLVIIIIVATLLELIMPPGKLKPLVQMTIGFFVIITILNPALTILFQEERLGVNTYTLPDEVNQQLNQALMTGQQINKDLKFDMNEQLKSRMEGQIRSLALLAPGVGEIKPLVKLDHAGNIKEVELTVVSGEGETSAADDRIPAFSDRLPAKVDATLERKLKDWISSYYGVAPERININWR